LVALLKLQEANRNVEKKREREREREREKKKKEVRAALFLKFFGAVRSVKLGSEKILLPLQECDSLICPFKIVHDDLKLGKLCRNRLV